MTRNLMVAVVAPIEAELSRAEMVFVAIVTLSSLLLQIRAGFLTGATFVDRMNAAVSVVLLALAGSLFVAGARALLRRPLTTVATVSS